MCYYVFRCVSNYVTIESSSYRKLQGRNRFEAERDRRIVLKTRNIPSPTLWGLWDAIRFANRTFPVQTLLSPAMLEPGRWGGGMPKLPDKHRDH